jgi:hypothetical protein
MSKQVATVTLEGTGKRRGPRKRWGDEAAEELNKMEIQTGRHWSETVGGGGIFYAQSSSGTKCSA